MSETRESSTPSSKWFANGEKDPHDNHYDCERSALCMGNLTDDELANALFLCDHRTSFESIGYLTAAKDRIRWLSRKLNEAISRKPLPEPSHNHSPCPWTFTQNSWSHTSIYDANSNTIAVIDISDQCNEETQFEYEELASANAKLIVESVNYRSQIGTES